MTTFDEIADAVEKSRADMAHRDDLARDVARLWPDGARNLVRSADPQLAAALDRLAAAYGTQQEG